MMVLIFMYSFVCCRKNSDIFILATNMYILVLLMTVFRYRDAMYFIRKDAKVNLT